MAEERVRSLSAEQAEMGSNNCRTIIRSRLARFAQTIACNGEFNGPPGISETGSPLLAYRAGDYLVLAASSSRLGQQPEH